MIIFGLYENYRNRNAIEQVFVYTLALFKSALILVVFSYYKGRRAGIPKPTEYKRTSNLDKSDK